MCSVLTSNSTSRTMFPVTEPLMARGLTVAADRFGDRPALLAGEATFSFRDLDLRSNGFARYLATLGVGQGQRVGVMLTNRPEFVTTVYALSKLGAAPVLINPSWKAL